MRRKPISGVYAFVNRRNGKVYVGSGINVLNRLSVHLTFLRRGTHHSSYLQRAWARYGEQQFAFALLERVSRIENLAQREQWYIDELGADDPDTGYNVCPFAFTNLLMRHSKATIDKMRASAKRVANAPQGKLNRQAQALSQWASNREEMLGYTAIARAALKRQLPNIMRKNWRRNRAHMMVAAVAKSVAVRRKLAKDPAWREKLRLALVRSPASRKKAAASLRKAWRDGKFKKRVTA